MDLPRLISLSTWWRDFPPTFVLTGAGLGDLASVGKNVDFGGRQGKWKAPKSNVLMEQTLAGEAAGMQAREVAPDYLRKRLARFGAKPLKPEDVVKQ